MSRVTPITLEAKQLNASPPYTRTIRDENVWMHFSFRLIPETMSIAIEIYNEFIIYNFLSFFYKLSAYFVVIFGNS